MLSHCVLISQRILTLLFSITPSGECSYDFSTCSNSYIRHKSQWILLATLSCLLLYSLYELIVIELNSERNFAGTVKEIMTIAVGVQGVIDVFVHGFGW